MTIQSYLLFVATQPLLLRLSMVAIIVAVFLAAHALAERVFYPRPKPARNAVRQVPRKVIYVPPGFDSSLAKTPNFALFPT